VLTIGIKFQLQLVCDPVQPNIRPGSAQFPQCGCGQLRTFQQPRRSVSTERFSKLNRMNSYKRFANKKKSMPSQGKVKGSTKSFGAPFGHLSGIAASRQVPLPEMLMTKAESIYQKVSPNRILKVIALLYGAVAHAAFFVTMHYAARFIMSLAVPKSIDTGTSTPSTEALISSQP